MKRICIQWSSNDMHCNMCWSSCKDKSTGKTFEVSGTITNNSAKMIYLEAVANGYHAGICVDSAKIGKDGKYSLKADATEASVL